MPIGSPGEYTYTFQSTLSMRRATQLAGGAVHVGGISIHALHEESDRPVGSCWYDRLVISIHALHEESDWCRLG